ncbi:hypothetical protein [Vitreimonas flagellata]|uniref:hypothetical protein n=1 Tax=Vitreimonas flagellata TaxID=2560861 RepID=UPI0010756426|nr:hypothetical protein [Vitreimonas flagellata]
MTLFANVERLLASLVALLLFTLNEVRMFQSLPRSADPGDGRVHAVWMQIGDAPAQVYLSVFDMSLRWGLAGLTAALAIWALIETFQQAKVRS